VGDVETTVNGSFEGSEDFGSGCGASETDVEEGLESTTTVFFVKFGFIETEFGKGTTGTEETSAVDGSVIGQTNLDTKGGQFVGISGSKDNITLDLGIDDLAHNVGISDTDNKTVLGGVVLVLVLDDETFAGVVISLSFATAAILDLVAFEVSFILLNFNEWL
jgi:hypothetical protein